MRLRSFLPLLAVTSSMAFPAMDTLVKEVQKRQFTGSTEMIGDLRTLPEVALSAVAKEIKKILLGTGSGTDLTSTYTAPPGGKDAAACRQDRCCIWKYIVSDMRTAMFDATGGVCTDTARGAIRLGFHDAASWSKDVQGRGGADGSILLSFNDEEMGRFENAALAAVGAQFRTWFNAYKGYGITMADLIQTGAKVAAVSCPGGPRIRMFVGRVDNPQANPAGLLPPPFFGAPAILDMFANKTIGPGGVVALIGAHTASRQRTIDLTRVGDPQDSTPGTWDTTYFTETLAASAPDHVFRFQSDVSLAHDPVSGPIFQQFSGAGGKNAWDKAYASEYIRMSLLGVGEINGLVECTKVMPAPV